MYPNIIKNFCKLSSKNIFGIFGINLPIFRHVNLLLINNFKNVFCISLKYLKNIEHLDLLLKKARNRLEQSAHNNFLLVRFSNTFKA